MIKNMISFSICLGLICGISAGSLTFVYKYTMPIIKLNIIREEKERLKLMFPAASNFVTKKVDNNEFKIAYKKKSPLGLVRKVTFKGYGGEMEVMFGLDNEEKIVGVKVISHKETPGLGANVTKDDFLTRYTGKKKDKLFLKKDNSTGEIDGWTGATITSRSITNGLRNSIEEIDFKGIVRETK